MCWVQLGQSLLPSEKLIWCCVLGLWLEEPASRRWHVVSLFVFSSHPPIKLFFISICGIFVFLFSPLPCWGGVKEQLFRCLAASQGQHHHHCHSPVETCYVRWVFPSYFNEWELNGCWVKSINLSEVKPPCNAAELNPLSDAQLHQITSSQLYQSDHAQQPIWHNVEFALLD